jgi:hypothetical protein
MWCELGNSTDYGMTHPRITESIQFRIHPLHHLLTSNLQPSATPTQKIPNKKGTLRCPSDTQISLSQQNRLELINASHVTLEAISLALDIQLNSCIYAE